MLEAQAAYDSAFAQLKASRETLILLIGPDEVRGLNWSGNGHPLSEFTLNSPIAGTLVRRDLTVGSLTDSNDDPMVVIDLDDVWQAEDGRNPARPSAGREGASVL